MPYEAVHRFLLQHLQAAQAALRPPQQHSGTASHQYQHASSQAAALQYYQQNAAPSMYEPLPILLPHDRPNSHDETPVTRKTLFFLLVKLVTFGL